jgi:hypothetical protein
LDYFLNTVLVFKGDECLIWPFGRTSKGYAANLLYNGISQPVHRHVCTYRHGPPPFPGAEASHICGKGNEACTNPNHVLWETHSENERRKRDHGTDSRGTRNGRANLSEAQVLAILLDDGDYLTIAKAYGISHSIVSHIKNGRVWQHVIKGLPARQSLKSSKEGGAFVQIRQIFGSMRGKGPSV